MEADKEKDKAEMRKISNEENIKTKKKTTKEIIFYLFFFSFSFSPTHSNATQENEPKRMF